MVINEIQTLSTHTFRIDFGGIASSCITAGNPNNPPLLLLHDGAWGGSAEVSWGNLFAAFASDYYVIAPDLVGFGASDKAVFLDRSPYSFRIDQIVNLLRALERVDGLNVVGTSFGGSLVLHMLNDRRLSIRKAVSIAGTGGLWKTKTMQTALGHWDGTREDLARVLGYLMDTSAPNFQEQLDLRHKSAAIPGHYRAVQAVSTPIPEALKVDRADGWPSTLNSSQNSATLLVACTQDTLFEPDWPEKLVPYLKDPHVIRMNALHSPNLDSPEKLYTVLFDFLS